MPMEFLRFKRDFVTALEEKSSVKLARTGNVLAVALLKLINTR